jgi:hypothetical protein
LANVGKSIPPAFPSPFSSPFDMGIEIEILVVTEKKWPIEMKDVEK